MAELLAARIELSAGGLIFRRVSGGAVEVLVIKDGYGNWGWPKGHVEAGESAEAAALRECREETGLTRLQARGLLGATDWYFWVEQTRVHKFCDCFLIEADPAEGTLPRRAEGIQGCSWLKPEEAAHRLTYANARLVLAAALRRPELRATVAVPRKVERSRPADRARGK